MTGSGATRTARTRAVGQLRQVGQRPLGSIHPFHRSEVLLSYRAV